MVDHATTEFDPTLASSTYASINGRMTVIIADRIAQGWVYWTSGDLRYSGQMPTDKWRRMAEISKTITQETEA